MSLVDVVAVNPVRVKDGDEKKTAFQTRYGLYAYLLTPFCRYKAPGRLQDACLAYLDPRKCQSKVQQVGYQGLILTTESLEMDPEKAQTVLDWNQLRNVKDVQAFPDFANLCRRLT